MTFMMGTLPILEIFLGVMGFGFTILFCTTFCKACSRIREQERQRERERENWRSGEQDGRPPSIYFIPYSRNTSQQEGEDHFRPSEYRQEPSAPPRYSNTVYFEPPPAYNELACKPDDLPPPYTRYNIPVYPVSPPPHRDLVQSQTEP